MGCGASKTKIKKRQEKQTTTISNGHKITSNRQNNNRAANHEVQSCPLSKTFEIAALTGASKMPFCIYSFEICKPNSKKSKVPHPSNKNIKDDYKVTWRVKKLVLDQCLGNMLKGHQVDSKSYLVDIRASRLYTQFVIKNKAALTIKFGGADCCFKRYVSVKVPRLIGPKYELKKETYLIAIKSMVQPVQDLNSEEIQRAVNALLLADVIANPSFAVIHDKKNIGRLFNVGNETHSRVVKKGACLRSCRGLATSIKLTNGNSSKSPRFVLTLAEELCFFFSPINMIELLRNHFRFDVSARLKRDEIEALNWDLKGLAVEMRAGDLGDGDTSTPIVHETSIDNISNKSIREELCDSYDESGHVVGKTTVEKLFKREFTHAKLKFTHLPCLISPEGRRMPMEVCWVKRGEMIKNKYPKQEELCDPDQLHLRRRIFQGNCDEFINQNISTFKQFGLQLKLARSVNSTV